MKLSIRSLIRSILVLAVAVVATASPLEAAPCTYHASPTGTGNGISVAQLFKIANSGR